MSDALQAILLGLIAAYGVFDYQLGTLYTFRPIVLGPLVGLVLGDLQTGIKIGATLELFFMGAISVGAYIPPDVVTGGVLATAYAIKMGQGSETAIALAMPIALLALAIKNFMAAVLPLIIKVADNGAEQGNDKKITFIHFLYGGAGMIRNFILVSLAFYFGASAMESLLEAIPQVFIDGMRVAAGLLPAMGFAMLMRMIMNKKLIPFYFLGFVLTAYLNMPVLGVAIIGLIIVLEKFNVLSPKAEAATVDGNISQGADEDEDF